MRLLFRVYASDLNSPSTQTYIHVDPEVTLH